MYHCFDSNSSHPIPIPNIPGTIVKPRISHFTSNAIVFEDGLVLSTSRTSPTSVLLGTGYKLLFPELEPFLETIPLESDLALFKGANASTLTTNLRYIHPLHQHIFAIDPRIPTNSLAFIGLPVWIANAPSDYAQGIYVAHAIAQDSLLPSRDTLLEELRQAEDDLRRAGIDPKHNGQSVHISNPILFWSEDS